MPNQYDPIDPLRFDAARVPDAVQGILLVQVTEDEETFMSRLSDCPSGLSNECGESYSAYYNLETGYLPILTPKQAPHTLQITPAVPGACDVEINECCQLAATHPLVVANPGVNPNQYLYTIAVLPSKAKTEAGCITGGCSDLDYNGLVAAIAMSYTAIKADYPAFVLDATTLFIHNQACCGGALKCIKDLNQLITDVNTLLAEPAIIPGNPVCGGITALPDGVIALYAGLDAAGQCVKAAPGGGAGAPSTVTTFTATAAGLSVAVDGTTAVVIPWGTIINEIKNDPSLVTVTDGFGTPIYKALPL